MTIAVALIVVTTGMLLVRAGWNGPRPLAIAGWLAIAVGAGLLTMRDGAWGLAVGTVAASVVALAMVLQAGWTSPERARRAPREAPAIPRISGAIPRHWPEVLRRIGVFALVVPVAFLAAQWLAFGAHALARRAGAGDADAIVLTLFLQPILWSLLMTIQMTRIDARHMIAPPIAAVAIGTILWGVS